MTFPTPGKLSLRHREPFFHSNSVLAVLFPRTSPAIAALATRLSEFVTNYHE